MRDYELMCVLDPNLDEAGLEAQNERIKSLIGSRRGEVTSVDPWGRRRLAYPIGGFRDGFYTVVKFRMPPEESDALERNLQLTDTVVRHLVTRLDSN